MDIELVPNTLQYTGPSHMFPLKSLYEACFFLIMKKRYLIYKIKHSICHYYSYLLLTVRSLLKNNKVTFKKKTLNLKFSKVVQALHRPFLEDTQEMGTGDCLWGSIFCSISYVGFVCFTVGIH